MNSTYCSGTEEEAGLFPRSRGGEEGVSQETNDQGLLRISSFVLGRVNVSQVLGCHRAPIKCLIKRVSPVTEDEWLTWNTSCCPGCSVSWAPHLQEQTTKRRLSVPVHLSEIQGALCQERWSEAVQSQAGVPCF